MENLTAEIRQKTILTLTPAEEQELLNERRALRVPLVAKVFVDYIARETQKKRCQGFRKGMGWTQKSKDTLFPFMKLLEEGVSISEIARRVKPLLPGFSNGRIEQKIKRFLRNGFY